MERIAGHEVRVLGRAFLGELDIDQVRAFFASEADGGFFRVESEPAGGLNRFGGGEIGRPNDTAWALHLAADVDEAFGDAHGNIDDGVNFLRDVGFADALSELGRARARGGENADEGKADEPLFVDLDRIGAGVRDALEGDGEAVAGAELRST